MTHSDDGYKITVDQNASFTLIVGLFDRIGTSAVTSSGWYATASIKESYTGSAALMYFSCSVTPLPSSSISMSLTADQTWALGNIGSRFVYDLIANNHNITPPRTYRILSGRLKVNLGVTEP